MALLVTVLVLSFTELNSHSEGLHVSAKKRKDTADGAVHTKQTRVTDANRHFLLSPWLFFRLVASQPLSCEHINTD